MSKKRIWLIVMILSGLGAVALLVYVIMLISNGSQLANGDASFLTYDSVLAAICAISAFGYYLEKKAEKNIGNDYGSEFYRHGGGNFNMDHKQLYKRPDGSMYVKYNSKGNNGKKEYKILNIPRDWKGDPMEYEASHRNEYSDWMSEDN